MVPVFNPVFIPETNNLNINNIYYYLVTTLPYLYFPISNTTLLSLTYIINFKSIVTLL